jgi:Na+:H+ antiporter, NhaA family
MNPSKKGEHQPGRWLQPLHEFLRLEAAAGIVLMIAAVAAMGAANSPLAALYERLLRVQPFINDGLMTVFFLLVGLELKRELLIGHLAARQRAVLPVIAAAGGMLFPALIYVAINRADPLALRGWAIPTATDIAFALGVLALLGSRVPTALKAFLLSIAIFDDLGAIAIIAVFYGHSLSLPMLAAVTLMAGVLAVLNLRNVQHPLVWMAAGLLLWWVVLKSGVHATLAGVILAMFIPLRGAQHASGDTGLLQRLERTLHPWVAFGILPLFAFANAGVPLTGLTPAVLLEPAALGVILGLVVGKQVGIMLVTGLAVRSGFAALPRGVSWAQLYGAALLCGIGFTMSLFIAALAVPDAGQFALARLGVLAGTLLSGLAGYVVLRQVLPRA